jgi:PAS domain S-box-containing protein
MTEKPTYEELEQRVKELEKENTALKRADEALQRSEEKFRSALMDLPIMINAVDQNSIIVFWNKKCEEITGYKAAEMIGNPNAMELLYPDGEYLETELEKWAAQNYQLKNAELILNAKDGSAKTVLWTNTDFLTPEWIWAVGVDITARKEAEVALQDNEATLAKAQKIAHIGNWNWDIVANRILWSDELYRIIGLSPQEFDAHYESYLKCIHPDDLEFFKNLTERVLKEKKPYSAEYRIVRSNNDIRIVHEIGEVTVDKNGNPINLFGTVQDITDSKQTAEALRESEEKLSRAKKMESLGLLAGGVAHDLNNVLSGIVSYPELILLDLPKDSKFRKPIETMQESGHRAAAIVHDLLTVARGVATSKEPLNLNDLIDDYLHSPEFNRLKQFHPTITVKTNLDTDLFNISGSHLHVRKVVMNLVSNASEAIEGSGNVTISTMNRYVDRPLRGYDYVDIGEYAHLSVSDDGSGISSDDLERIFEPFYTKKVMGRSGTGLGLAVVWNVMQDHQGYIDVNSDENGTTFEVYFPITRDEISDKDLSIPIKDYKGNGETILVVDDVESQREISCKMLDTLGYKTKAVSGGEEAVEYLKEHTIDLILLDMIMAPGINGRETYERVIKIHPNQKAIIVSGFAETNEVKEAQKLGAGRYIKKPITLETIGLAIKEELEK